MRAHVTWTETDGGAQAEPRDEVLEIRSPDLRRTELLLPIWLRQAGRSDLANLPADDLAARAPLTWICSLAHSAARRQHRTALTWDQWQETAEVDTAADDPAGQDGGDAEPDPHRPTSQDQGAG